MKDTITPLLRRVFRRSKELWKQRWTSPPQTRHENPYATLLPVLVALGQQLPVKHVLEFGSGFNSTFTFLNKDIFPFLVQLVSVENDPEWRRQIQQATTDPRLFMKPVEGAVSEAVSGDLLDSKELILIDDSNCAVDRAATIQGVVKLLTPNQVVIVHDYEVPEYRLASGDVSLCFVFDAMLPHTAVLSNGNQVDQRQLARMNAVIRSHSGDVHPTDTLRWKSLFS